MFSALRGGQQNRKLSYDIIYFFDNINVFDPAQLYESYSVRALLETINKITKPINYYDNSFKEVLLNFLY